MIKIEKVVLYKVNRYAMISIQNQLEKLKYDLLK